MGSPTRHRGSRVTPAPRFTSRPALYPGSGVVRTTVLYPSPGTGIADTPFVERLVGCLILQTSLFPKLV